MSLKNKTLYIIRGVSGSGKTTFANKICDHVVSADDFFYDGSDYNFDASKLNLAHNYCYSKVEDFLKFDMDVAVANTFTQEWEMKPYFDLAKRYDYTVFSVIVENRHGGKNIHNVPQKMLDSQRKRFSVCL